MQSCGWCTSGQNVVIVELGDKMLWLGHWGTKCCDMGTGGGGGQLIICIFYLLCISSTIRLLGDFYHTTIY